MAQYFQLTCVLQFLEIFYDVLKALIGLFLSEIRQKRYKEDFCDAMA